MSEPRELLNNIGGEFKPSREGETLEIVNRFHRRGLRDLAEIRRG